MMMASRCIFFFEVDSPVAARCCRQWEKNIPAEDSPRLPTRTEGMFQQIKHFMNMRRRGFSSLLHCETDVMRGYAFACDLLHIGRPSTWTLLKIDSRVHRVQAEWGFQLCYDENGCMTSAEDLGRQSYFLLPCNFSVQVECRALLL